MFILGTEIETETITKHYCLFTKMYYLFIKKLDLQ